MPLGDVFGAHNLPFWVQGGLLNPSRLPQEMHVPRLRRMQENRPDAADPDDLGYEAAMGLMPPAFRAVTAFPKVATALLSGYYGLSGTDPAGGAPKQNQKAQQPANAGTDAIKQLQTQLKAEGHYAGEIDGVDGPATKAALAKKMQADQLRVQQGDIDARQREADARDRDAIARQKETDRLAEADRIKKQQREEGQERYRQAEANVGGFSRLLRDYGTPAGVTAGLIAGPLARKTVTSTSNYLSQRAADRAESLLRRKIANDPGRVARINEIWRQGGQGGAVPFTHTPNQAPGFAPNPNAAPMGSLFQPNRAGNFAQDVGVMGAFGAEAAISAHMRNQAQEELAAATQAAAADMSDVNIGRLQQAKDDVAFYNGLMNVGRTAAFMYPASAIKMKRNPASPNLAKAEDEKLKIEELLRQQSPVAQALAGTAPTSPAMPQAVPMAPPALMLPSPGARPPWMREPGTAGQFDPFLDFKR